MNTQNKYLEKLQKEYVFVDIYTDYFEESIYGFIIKFNEEFLLIEKYTSLGKVDGIVIFKREDITRIKWGGNESENTYKLTLKEERIQGIENIKIDTLEELLKDVHRKFGYVSLSIQKIDPDMCIIGEIEEMDNDTIVIHEFGTFATSDRKRMMISLTEITRIDAGGQYEDNLKELFMNKN
jgi:hypothetical protein